MKELVERNVVIGSTLVAARYSLTISEHIIILIILGKLDQSVPPDTTRAFRVSVDEYCKLRKVDRSVAFKQLKEAAGDLFERELNYQELDEEGQLYKVRSRWVSSCYYNIEESCIKIRFVPEILKHLFDLKDNYTTLRLAEFGKLSSSYSMRILQLLCSNRYRGRSGKYEIYLDELQFMLEVPESYYSYAMFKLRVLNPVIKELGEAGKNVVEIKLVEKKVGKKVHSLVFDYTFTN
jgi:plasmid replication initiation protein